MTSKTFKNNTDFVYKLTSKTSKGTQALHKILYDDYSKTESAIMQVVLIEGSPFSIELSFSIEFRFTNFSKAGERNRGMRQRFSPLNRTAVLVKIWEKLKQLGCNEEDIKIEVI